MNNPLSSKPSGKCVFHESESMPAIVKIVCRMVATQDRKHLATVHLKGLDAYNSNLVDLEPDFSPASLSLRKKILENEKPFIRYYEYADFCGYSSIAVDKHSEVEITIFANADRTAWNRTNLTRLLKI